jgi:AraC family L-rhamnose operon transcriptional activator RhaR
VRYLWSSWAKGIPAVCATPWGGRHGHLQHDHDFLEIAVVTGGRGQHRTTGGLQMVARGDVLLLRPGVWHAYTGGRALAGWDCCIDPSVPGHELAWTVDDPDLGRLLWRGPVTQGGSLHLHLDEGRMTEVERILALLPATTGADDTRARRIGLLLQLLGCIAAALPAAATTGAVHPGVAAALRLIEQDPALPWTLNGLALRLHLRPGYFVRLFRAATGLPPLAYVRRRRAEIAAILLRRSELGIGEIGARVGWPDPSLFARRFRSLLGVSPSHWRKQNAVRATPARPDGL